MQEIKPLKIQVQQVHQLTHILQDQVLQALLLIHSIFQVFRVMLLFYQSVVELVATVKVQHKIAHTSAEFNFIKMELPLVGMANTAVLLIPLLMLQTVALEQEVN